MCIRDRYLEGIYDPDMVPIIRSIIYMRKKSHISLAGQIMDSMELDNVFDYRLPFYVGSIWPD